MINAVIIDDEPGARQSLKLLLKEYVPVVRVVGTADRVASGIKIIQEQSPQLVFLDIRLPDGDGFRVLEAIEEPQFEVIFTTAYGDYREQAFDFFALQYLLKPIDIDKLERTIAHLQRRRVQSVEMEKIRMLERLIKSKEEMITIPTPHGYTLEKVSEILHLEAQGNYTTIHMLNGQKHLCSHNMKFYENALRGGLFFRTHKSHLINTHYVREVRNDHTVVLTDGSSLPVSQRSRNNFMRFIQQRNK